jgi:hypothetical protein
LLHHQGLQIMQKQIPDGYRYDHLVKISKNRIITNIELDTYSFLRPYPEISFVDLLIS